MNFEGSPRESKRWSAGCEPGTEGLEDWNSVLEEIVKASGRYVQGQLLPHRRGVGYDLPGRLGALNFYGGQRSRELNPG